MIELGKTLRDAREAKGLTASRLSEITRIAPMTLKELEDENFAHISAPIYGRGFIKLYCAAVEIDPKPLIEAFMELYARSRGEEPAAVPPAKASPPPSAEPPPAATAPEPPVRRFAATARPTTPAPQQDDLFSAPRPAPAASAASPEAEPDAPSLSRYAAPVRQTAAAANPAAVLRLAVLAVAAFAVLALIAFGIRAVYRATARPGTDDPETVESVPVAKPAKIAEPSSKSESPAPAETETVAVRTPQSIPDLYID